MTGTDPGRSRSPAASRPDLDLTAPTVDLTDRSLDLTTTTKEGGPVAPVGPVPRELAASVLAVVGARRGDLVLDLAPTGRLTTSLAAAVGSTGRVLAVGPPSEPAQPSAYDNIRSAVSLAAVPDGCVSRIVLLAHETTARDLAPLLLSLRRVVLPGARVVVTVRPNTGGLADGLPAVLGECGLRVVHAEGVVTPDLRVALASALF